MRQKAYNILSLELLTRLAVVRDALDVSFYSEVDRLNCNESFARQPSDKTAEELFKMFDHDYQFNHFAFILKSNFAFDEKMPDYYYDVGFSVKPLRENNEYFLWVYINEEQGEKLIEKYKIPPQIA